MLKTGKKKFPWSIPGLYLELFLDIWTIPGKMYVRVCRPVIKKFITTIKKITFSNVSVFLLGESMYDERINIAGTAD